MMAGAIAKKFLHQSFVRIANGGRLYSQFVSPSHLVTHLNLHFWRQIQILNEWDLLILADVEISDLFRVVRTCRCEVLVVSSRDFPAGLVDQKMTAGQWSEAILFLGKNFSKFGPFLAAPAKPGLNRALFLDRDGVLIKNYDYNFNPEKIEINPEALSWIRKAREKDFFIIVISNQSGLARQKFSIDQYLRFESALQSRLSALNAFLDRTYYSGSHETSADPFYQVQLQQRKPRPGMFKKAAEDFNLNLQKCLFIGDQVSDMQAGFLSGISKNYLYNGSAAKYQEVKSWGNSFKLIVDCHWSKFSNQF